MRVIPPKVAAAPTIAYIPEGNHMPAGTFRPKVTTAMKNFSTDAIKSRKADFK
ncbi:38_t:CDS:2 [Acaulospora colombiana]|uniref:38_t:CDS:1 n=1 Tax=Acaulospora colombiana TaxID=27376 RepID=A0ACA9L5X3_9GLOM|nr:38_t:CDS:2 [Acaulospora colombiana]